MYLGHLSRRRTAFGVASDCQALVEKRQIKSLSSARQANEYAQRLLKLQPPFYAAYVSAGISEYLLGSLPFFIRWFVHLDNVQGGKGQAIQDLELVERQGLYLKPFARILLAIIYLCEKKPERSREFLQALARAPVTRLWSQSRWDSMTSMAVPGPAWRAGSRSAWTMAPSICRTTS